VAIIVWGAWSEMIVCAVAAMVWWASLPGTLVHNLAYKLILITGLAVFLFNWNPLIKLDGYYLLTEILGIPDLKEDSTLYVSSWVKKHIWRLPVDVPYVPKRRRLGYVIYALLSGLYSYSLLYLVARFVGNICTRYNPDWGFLAGVAMGLLIFRSRIKTLGRFMKTVYFDKKERVRAWFTPRRLVMVSGVLLALLLVPISHEKVEARYILEPVEKAVVRATVSGTVAEIYADEGDKVAVGAPLARLRNLALESRSGLVAAEHREASARATSAQLKYADYGFAERDRQRLATQERLLVDQVSRLRVSSPTSGVVLTPRVRDLIGSVLKEGDMIAEVADLSRMKARLYVPEHEVRKLRAGARSKLLPDSTFSSLEGTVVSIAPVSSEAAPALIDLSKYKGIHLPQFFVLTIAVDNTEGVLRDEMVGTAKIYGARRSWGLRLAEPLVNFAARKLW
jgi:putative peptide zinc metalloprotease protein